MKLGFIQVYNEANWIGFAIDQAMRLCDRVLIVEGAQYTNFPGIPERSDDGTLDIISDKEKEYPKRMQVINTTRKHDNYRLNQCDNFNNALRLCDTGDYFLILDADEFYSDKWIEMANELMEEGRIETIKVETKFFAFSFNWRIDFGIVTSVPIIIKKIKGFYFAPTSKRINTGKNTMTISGSNRFHYMWVKPEARLLTRMRTSGRYPGMVSWFMENWKRIRLEDGAIYQSYSKDFMLHKYEGDHPGILDNHPWRYVEDIRKLK